MLALFSNRDNHFDEVCVMTILEVLGSNHLGQFRFTPWRQLVPYFFVGYSVEIVTLGVERLVGGSLLLLLEVDVRLLELWLRHMGISIGDYLAVGEGCQIVDSLRFELRTDKL
jgi:hypothetical protein